MNVIMWLVVGMMWLASISFAFSDLMCILALIFNRNDRELVLVVCVFFVLFALLAVMTAKIALGIGRCL